MKTDLYKLIEDPTLLREIENLVAAILGYDGSGILLIVHGDNSDAILLSNRSSQRELILDVLSSTIERVEGGPPNTRGGRLLS